MKKPKFDIKIFFKLLSCLFIGIGLGLFTYPYFIDWMPLPSGLFLIIGIGLIIITK